MNKKDDVPKIILLIFVWLAGLITTTISLSCQYGITAILGITAPYYLTKFLLIEDKDKYEE